LLCLHSSTKQSEAKQSEAKQYIASITKGQQVYYAEMGVKGDIAKFCSTTGICAVPDSAIAW
jgi:hypothetical protein